MKPTIFLFLSLFLTACHTTQVTNQSGSDFNLDWKFSFAEKAPAWEEDFNDTQWRTLNLPHDWAIEQSIDSSIVFWQGTGHFPSEGIGWYRKTFPTPINDNEVCYVHFDGVYNNATIWINGTELGFHPYGYSPFYYDLTPYLHKNGQENVLAVKIDHTRYADSRWYTGAGIYRKVNLISVNKLHIPIWGVYATTPEVSKQAAKVHLTVDVRNDYDEPQSGRLTTVIYDPAGKEVNKQQIDIAIDSLEQVVLDFTIDQPQLWDTDTPNLYKAVLTIAMAGKVVDQFEQTFGIRSIRFDADKGFFLNGENKKIKGVCLHHDGGLVGTAVPIGVWRRRLETLKASGCNAIRSAHNPASSEFLDLCDEMGFLVQDEFFDEWDNPKDKRFNMNQQSEHYETQSYVEHFQEWAERDIRTTMLSHRNHPSIIQWSIGNEIEWTYTRNQNATGFFNNMDWKGNYFWSEPPFSTQKIKEMLETLPNGKYDIGKTAQQLADWTRLYDTTRAVTANCILPSASHLSGYIDALDIAGYSYRRVLYNYGHENYPTKPIMGMENVPHYHEWKAVMDNDHIAGTYLWTGVDYLGEIRDKFPTRTGGSGLLDLAGFPKPQYYMFQALWTEEPMVYMTTNLPKQLKSRNKQLYRVESDLSVSLVNPDSWKRMLWGWQTVNQHWNYQPGDTVIVEVMSNCPSVELFLNNQSLGTKQLTDFPDHILKWAVPYTPGELKAIGQGTNQTVNYSYHTAGVAKAMEVVSDKKGLAANHYDVAHLRVQLVDENGHPSNDNRLVAFEVSEHLEILGIDNGAPVNGQDVHTNQMTTDKGRVLLIVQAKDLKGQGTITVKSEGLPDQKMVLAIQ
ncbi:MAG: sugar-binding domain-containing protein [Bacteroidota bacterium]